VGYGNSSDSNLKGKLLSVISYQKPVISYQLIVIGKTQITINK